ncbi:MAG: family 78 glycoside hydrolase catalytic domain [Methanoregulaceae archaeon]|nr:family 78 glycoside hydrolase catalytic domain [Methanoregulaceae archaeon]
MWGLLLAVPMLQTMSVVPDHLRVEFLEKPLGVATSKPRFSWWVTSDQATARQAGYQVQVRSGDDVVWDSGRVGSSNSQLIEYAGEKLSSGQGLEWRVRLWDGANKAGKWSSWEPFRIGLLSESDWRAKWISGEMIGGRPAGPHNGYHAEFTTNQTEEKWVEIDLGKPTTIDRLVLYPTRPFDWTRDEPGFQFPIDFRFELDGKVIDQAADHIKATEPVERRLSSPVTGQKLRLVVTKMRDRGGVQPPYAFTLAELEARNGDQVVSRGATVTSKDSIENTSWGRKKLTDGDTRSHPAENIEALPATELRRSFTLKGPVREAIIHATALGAYELQVNGKAPDNRVLAPEWTDYHSRVQVQTYDVTRLLQSGANAVDVVLGDGWYAGRLGMAQALDEAGLPRAVYGRHPAFCAQIEITYRDGRKERIITDRNWMTSREGPIRSSDLLDGEVYDATKLPVGGWVAAQEVSPDPKPLRVPQPNEPIRIVEKLAPVSVKRIGDKKHLIDFGQNLPGWVALKMKGSHGDKVTVRHAEMLENDTTVYVTNLRGAPQVDRYVLDGTDRWYRPHFTYHGFRYAEVDGIADLPAEAVEAQVFCSSSPEAAKFETSSPMVNRLWQNIRWTQRANLMSVPTDCPQRDERLGWTGDILAYAPTASYFMDMAAFYTKWMPDMRDAQAEFGAFADFAPHPYGKDRHFTSAPGWGDAGVGVPHTHWQFYADKELLRRHHASMEKYLDYVLSRNPDGLWLKDRRNDYGDWLNGDTLVREGYPRTGAECPKDVFATLIQFRSADQMAQMSRAIGKPSTKWEQAAAKIAAAFKKAYVDAEGKIKGDTQAGYALALEFGILAERDQPAAFAHLVKAVDARNGHLSTGFHSTQPLMTVLTNRGRPDLAYKILMNDTFPSWGYTIANGATSIWERWDGFVKGRGFQDPGMNSFNHWALGSVGQWMMETVLGVQRMGVGWSKFRIAAVPGGGLEFAKGHYDSPVGRIGVEWRFVGDEWNLSVVIPANSEAEILLPNGKREQRGPGRHEFKLTGVARA